MEKGHILKFVVKGKTFDENVGIKTYPRQTYGVSEQSPDHFKQKNTLIGDHGYIYKHQNKPEFQYPSQRKSYNLHKEVDELDYSKLHINLMQNSAAFHRKKGRLSQFMDKNGWIGEVTPLMGFERSQQARQFSNRDREDRIKSLKPKRVYQFKAKQPKVNQEYFNTISTLMGQKLKIRKQRVELNKQNLILSARAQSRPLQPRDPIYVDNIVENMAKTSLDFYSTSSTFYKRNEISRQKSDRTGVSTSFGNQSSRLSFRTSLQKRGTSPAKSFKQSSKQPILKKIMEPDAIENQNQNVQDWYRRTCQNKWVYKPKEVDSEDQF